MKTKIILALLLTGFISVNAFSQKIVWRPKANLPLPMRGTAISCNNKIYFMEANINISGVYEYGEVLLLGGGNSWEITGARYNDSLSVKEFV